MMLKSEASALGPSLTTVQTLASECSVLYPTGLGRFNFSNSRFDLTTAVFFGKTAVLVLSYLLAKNLFLATAKRYRNFDIN